MWFVTTDKHRKKGFFPWNMNGVWARQDSNLRPSDYESPALTAAPRARYKVSSAPVLSVTQPDTWNVTLKHLLEREMGFEPTNISLEGWCLTTWRLPHILRHIWLKKLIRAYLALFLVDLKCYQPENHRSWCLDCRRYYIGVSFFEQVIFLA